MQEHRKEASDFINFITTGLMKNLIYLLLALSLASCNTDNEPDLTSSKITFNFDAGPSDYRSFYAVISDTTGKVLHWSKLTNEKIVEFQYPADASLAYVTIISKSVSGTDYSVFMNTYTNVAGGDYSFKYATPPSQPTKTPKGTYKITFEDRNFILLNTSVISGDAILDQLDSDNENYYHTWDLFDQPQYNLTLGLSNIPKGTARPQFKYFTRQNVKPGEQLVVTEADFNAYETSPQHNITYPDAAQLGTKFYGQVSAVNNNTQNFTLFSDFIYKDHFSFDFPDIPNVFNKYSVYLSGTDNLSAYTTIVTGPALITSFSNLQASLTTLRSASTKRIDADVSGAGDVINIDKSISLGANKGFIQWTVFNAMATKVRINPPQDFPSDLLTEIPVLSSAKDVKFSSFEIAKYNMSYEEFVNSRLKGSPGTLFRYPDFEQSRTYYPDASTAGRTTLDVSEKIERRKNLNAMDF